MSDKNSPPLVGIIMGSQSDWETMQHAALQLDELGVPYESLVISAHRTPDLLFEYASGAAARGLEVIIAAAGGAAHLAGVTAAKTCLPVLGVPMESKSLHGMDSLLSMVQMPGGVPVGNPGHRQTRRGQRRPAGRRHPGQQIPAPSRRLRRIPPQTNRARPGQPHAQAAA